MEGNLYANNEDDNVVLLLQYMPSLYQLPV